MTLSNQRSLENRRLVFRCVIGAFYLFAGVIHVTDPRGFLPIVPDWVPAKLDVILFTGVCEIAGAIGLMNARLRKWAGWGLAAYAVCVFPANVKQAMDHISLPGLPDTWWYHGPRFVMQPVIIWATLVGAGIVTWPFKRTQQEKGSGLGALSGVQTPPAKRRPAYPL